MTNPYHFIDFDFVLINKVFPPKEGQLNYVLETVSLRDKTRFGQVTLDNIKGINYIPKPNQIALLGKFDDHFAAVIHLWTGYSDEKKRAACTMEPGEICVQGTGNASLYFDKDGNADLSSGTDAVKLAMHDTEGSCELTTKILSIKTDDGFLIENDGEGALNISKTSIDPAVTDKDRLLVVVDDNEININKKPDWDVTLDNDKLQITKGLTEPFNWKVLLDNDEFSVTKDTTWEVKLDANYLNISKNNGDVTATLGTEGIVLAKKDKGEVWITDEGVKIKTPTVGDQFICLSDLVDDINDLISKFNSHVHPGKPPTLPGDFTSATITPATPVIKNLVVSNS